MPATLPIEREAHKRAENLVAVLEPHTAGNVSLPTIRVFLESVDDSLQTWVAATSADNATRAGMRVLALRNSFLVFVSAWNQSVPATATALLSAWVEAAQNVNVRVPGVRIRHEVPHLVMPSLDAIVAFETGVVEFICSVISSIGVAGIIRRLLAHLRVSYDEMGRMVGATGETIRRWEQGQHAPPLEKQAVLTTADAALSRLLTMFKADALPEVIRRQAEIFDNERALDWILRGRIVEVVDRYERELSFQR